MPFTEDQLNDVYDSTGGYCHYCGMKLAFVNYGRHNRRGSWHVDHSIPKSRGGTDYLRNLRPACIDCNLDKGVRNGKYYRHRFEPTTFGGQLAKALGLPDGFLGASRRKRLI